MNLQRVLLIAGVGAIIAISTSDLSAQPPPAKQKLLPTTVADNTFGEGGKKVTRLNEKNLIDHIEWMDSEGHLRASHSFDYDRDQKLLIEFLTFYSKDDSTRQLAFYSAYLESTPYTSHYELSGNYNDGGPKSEDKAHSLADYESFLEAALKQFAEDGTLLRANKEAIEQAARNKPADKAALFDCLKSKFPNVQATFKDVAFDFDSNRQFAWREDRQAWVDAKTLESVCPPSEMDPCLVGMWECTSFKGQFFTGGGAGFKVTFKNDGTEIVDYSTMQPLQAGPRDKFVYTGSATARISAKDGVAKMEKMEGLGPTMSLQGAVNHQFGNLPNLGPAGLGSASDNNKYTCAEDTLEYQTSAQRNAKANCTVKLTRVKVPAGEPPPLPSSKDVLAPPNESKKPPAEKTAAQQAAMLKALEGNPSDAQKQKPADKAPTDAKVAPQNPSQKQGSDAKNCDALKDEIRKLQASLVELGKKQGFSQELYAEWNETNEKVKARIKEAEKNKDEDERDRLLGVLNDNLKIADSYKAKVASIQAEQEQVRKEIEELMTQLADCKSKPHE